MGVAIEVSGLCFSYGRGGHQLRDVSLTVAEGDVCCLLGPNGAGKTTLLSCLLKLIRPHAGTMRVGGTDVWRLSHREMARRLAYVPQSTSTPFPFTALDMVVMGRTPHMSITSSPSAADRRAAAGILADLGIGHLEDRPFSVLSGGERRLVLMARAVAQDSPILVLDEPTSALDFGNEARVLELVHALARGGRTILMTTHQPSHALVCARQAVLFRDGRIVADGPARDVVTGGRLTELYGVEVRVLTATHDSPSPESGACELYACAPAIRTDSTMAALNFPQSGRG